MSPRPGPGRASDRPVPGRDAPATACRHPAVAANGLEQGPDGSRRVRVRRQSVQAREPVHPRHRSGRAEVGGGDGAQDGPAGRHRPEVPVLRGDRHGHGHRRRDAPALAGRHRARGGLHRHREARGPARRQGLRPRLRGVHPHGEGPRVRARRAHPHHLRRPRRTCARCGSRGTSPARARRGSAPGRAWFWPRTSSSPRPRRTAGRPGTRGTPAPARPPGPRGTPPRAWAPARGPAWPRGPTSRAAASAPSGRCPAAPRGP